MAARAPRFDGTPTLWSLVAGLGLLASVAFVLRLVGGW